MKSFLLLILLITCIGFFVYVYHKIFDVYVFGAEGFLGHIITCLIGGCILWYLAIKYWVIAIIVVIIVIGVASQKAK